MVSRAEAERWAAEAFTRGAATARQIEAFNPFARSHHSDLTACSPEVASTLSPTSAAKARAAKRAVAEFYGLTDPDPNYLVDMLGNRAPFHLVTRAHLYPRSYTNFHLFASYMSLPPDFNTNPRNFLLLDKEIHDAFDAGYVGFIPRSGALIIRVFRPTRVTARVASLDGQQLHWPIEASQPYRRILGWFAWLAKGTDDTSAETANELEAALNASGDDGNTALQRAIEEAISANKVVRSMLV